MVRTFKTKIYKENFTLDTVLEKRIERLISNKFKQTKYGNIEQFINYAVIELLEKEERS